MNNFPVRRRDSPPPLSRRDSPPPLGRRENIFPVRRRENIFLFVGGTALTNDGRRLMYPGQAGGLMYPGQAGGRVGVPMGGRKVGVPMGGRRVYILSRYTLGYAQWVYIPSRYTSVGAPCPTQQRQLAHVRLTSTLCTPLMLYF